MRECPRCLNRDPRYFYKGKKGIYCRKCIRFKRILLSEDLMAPEYDIDLKAGYARFTYPLTPYQAKAALDCLINVRYRDVLLHCVCGAGKTEIVVATMADYLSRGLKIAYAIARKEVVKELAGRFKILFPKAKVIAVYGGHSEEKYGDIIVCTTHQLYRYPKTFDLLILDEVDAFPFKGDEVLNNIAYMAAKGRIIYSTATVDKHLSELLKKDEVKEVSLPIRPHLKPLIVPRIIKGPKVYLLIRLFLLLKNSKRQMIIFVSSKKTVLYLYYLFHPFFNCTYVYSDLDKRDAHIKAFRDRKYDFIFATTVLERGITVKGVSVIVLVLHEGVFDKASLIQMLGRVGRDFHDPEGEAYILTMRMNAEIDDCIREIGNANEQALSLLRQSY